MPKTPSFLVKISVYFVWEIQRSFINLLIGNFLKIKTYILTIKYNVDEDRPEFITEELITEGEDVVVLEYDSIDDIQVEDFEDFDDIGLA
jgi:hypothetical protein